MYNLSMSNEKRKLFVISGSSGVGKGTVIKGFLAKHSDFVFSVSCTTRDKREGEVDGVDYFFISKEEFTESIQNNEFIEWANFSDNYYGTKKSFIEKTFNEGKDLILEIDTQGAIQIKEKMPAAVLIFIEPPSYQDLEFRLRNRKTENEESIQKRLDFVKMEMRNSEYFDYKIVNDRVDLTVQELEIILRTERAY